jgi:hypothetical protein
VKRGTIIFSVLLLTHPDIFADNNDKFHSRQSVKKVAKKPEKQIVGENHITDKEEALFDMKTKNLFDYNTLLYTTPFAAKYNLTRWRRIKKLDIQNLDLYTYKQKHLYKIQDLGNEGTAVKFLYPNINPYPGRVSGYDAFDIYKVRPLERRYYDTHGPLFDGNVVFGNYGTYLFQLLGAQSINKNWHVSFTLDSLLSDKEYVHTEKHDWQVVTYPLSLNLHYKNDDETYLAFFSFYRKKHRVHESGGISLNYATSEGKVEKDFAKWLTSSAVSNNIYPHDRVFSKNFVKEYFFYHQYEISKGFQIFNELKWAEEENTFKIEALPNTKEKHSEYPEKTGKSLRYLSGKYFRDVFNFEPFSDKNKFLSRYCEVGIKGELARLFYELHYKLNFINNFFIYRKTKLHQRKDHEREWFENFVGGTLKLNISGEDFVFAQGDFIVDEEKCFAAQGGYEGRFGNLKYIVVRHSPDLLSQFYKNSESFLRHWKNENFEVQLDQQVLFEGNLDFSIFTFRPMCSFILQKNPIVYKKDSDEAVISATCKPTQEKESKSLFVGGLVGIKVFDYHWDVDVVKSIFEKKNIPSWKFTTRLYYLHEFDEKRGELTCGVEFNWNTPYFGDAYDPVIQKFYSQDFFEMYSYPLLGVYINLRINKFRIFTKVINILQYANKEKTSYYASPFYPGQKRIFDFGVAWSVFN